jgi:hypothetical protein
MQLDKRKTRDASQLQQLQLHLCSPPKAQKLRIGGQMAISLPGRLDEAVAHHTARHTNQLASTARLKACGSAGRAAARGKACNK